MSEYRSRIDAFSIETIPMARLAEYGVGLARLLGAQEHVHFKKLEPGSAVLVSSCRRLRSRRFRKFGKRIKRVREGRARKDALEAFKAIDDLLARDNAVGTLIPTQGAQIFDFPGRRRPKPVRYGPFREWGSLDGVVFRLGGRDKTIPVSLRNGAVDYPCHALVEISKHHAQHYFENTLRVHGSGKWVREKDETWTLKRFDIDDFEVFDDAPFNEVIRRLHAVEGGSWNDLSLTDILGLRRDQGGSIRCWLLSMVLF